MDLGISVVSFSWPDAPVSIAPTLQDIARRSEDAGLRSLWVMDHFFQIPPVGPAELEMLEAYTTLGFCAGVTARIELGALVTGVTYRNPGILAKQVTTLDVLSGGRAWLGIGAAWFDREHDGLGVPFPGLGVRFEMLEDALQVALQMWSDEDGPFEGRHVRLEETLNSPPAISNPHPRILIGGAGEKKTLRLVAKYAQACNIFAMGEDIVKHKFAVLAEHCEREGTDYDAIEKTLLVPVLPVDSEGAKKFVEEAAQYAELGADQLIVGLVGPPEVPLGLAGDEIVPALVGL